MSKYQVHMETKIKAKENVLSIDIGTELALVNIETDRYFGLSTTGTIIWKLLREQFCIKDVVSSLLYKYDIKNEVCEAQVFRFVENLLAENLVEIV